MKTPHENFLRTPLRAAINHHVKKLQISSDTTLSSLSNILSDLAINEKNLGETFLSHIIQQASVLIVSALLYKNMIFVIFANFVLWLHYSRFIALACK